MKNRLKGLFALLLAICLILGISITAMASTYKILITTDLTDEILYSGDTIENSGQSSGCAFIIYEEDGTITANQGGSIHVADLSTRPSNDFSTDQSPLTTYTIPENSRGHYGYVVDDKLSNNAQVPLNLKFTKNNGTESVTLTSNDSLLYEDNYFHLISLTEIPIEYKLTLNGNSGTVTNATASLTFDTSDKLTEIPTRAGYKFVGWNTQADGLGVTVPKDATADNLSNTLTNVTYDTTTAASAKTNPIVLYAQWEKITDDTPAATGETTEANAATTTQPVNTPHTADSTMIAAPIALTLASAGAIILTHKKRHSI